MASLKAQYMMFFKIQEDIWISTDNGLNKYDGYSMKSYQYMHNDQNSISEGAPRTIFEDMDGYIWVSTNQGLVNKSIRILKTLSELTLLIYQM